MHSCQGPNLLQVWDRILWEKLCQMSETLILIKWPQVGLPVCVCVHAFLHTCTCMQFHVCVCVCVCVCALCVCVWVCVVHWCISHADSCSVFSLWIISICCCCFLSFTLLYKLTTYICCLIYHVRFTGIISVHLIDSESDHLWFLSLQCQKGK